jgi:ABC-type transport system involved in multi-copper enzyme maturation permease subunit
VGRGTGLDLVLAGVLRDYAVFHGLVAVLCVGWAVVRLRPVALRQLYGVARKPAWGFRHRFRPTLGDWPMIWKEVFVEPGQQFGWFGRLVLAVLVGASLWPLFSLDDWAPPGGQAPAEVFFFASRVLGSMAACLLLLLLAVRAANAISRERDQQTFDSLLTTPLGTGAILGSKWVGSIRGAPWGWLWLGIIWGFGVVRGGMHPAAVLLLAGAWLVYAAAMVTVGLWYSLASRTSLRATIATLLVTLAVGCGHLLLPLTYLPLSDYRSLFWERVYRVQLGLSPPVVLGKLLPFTHEDLSGSLPSRHSWELPMGLVGVSCWAVGTALLGLVLVRRFREVTGRQALRRPERDTPPPEPAPSEARAAAMTRT